MRAFLWVTILLLIVDAAIDYYLWRRASRLRCPFWKWLQAITAILFAAEFIVGIAMPYRGGEEALLRAKSWLFFIYFSVYIPKWIAFAFLMLSAIPRLWGGKRWRVLSWAGCLLAVTYCAAMWWGALVNRFNIAVERETIAHANLPTSFDGLKIAQISDLHTGTFGNDTAFVSSLVDSINALHPDIVVFTGDIVNRQSSELVPFIPALQRIKAPMGAYAVLGNHDYGDYGRWSSPEEKQADRTNLRRLYASTPFKLLRDSTVWLRSAQGDSMAIIGVENVGDAPFPSYGSLRRAFPAIDSNAAYKLLLTHNPAHWTDSIRNADHYHVDLTLSGHTHAMQMEWHGITPARWRYEAAMGRYDNSDSTRTLYVNRGAGTVGLPMRIGADPEITLITLKSQSALKAQ